uniref:SCP domain-containing protein n=1 Tax=Strongyloides papillosus TaxID=174720 RepID=A0A0N5B3Z1_STREA
MFIYLVLAYVNDISSTHVNYFESGKYPSNDYLNIIETFKSHKIVKRRAFELVRLETQFGKLHHHGRFLRPRNLGIDLQQDEALEDKYCQEKCNEDLRTGLDMVKAHSSFGSIGVPSVIDEDDLNLFCKIDGAHDECLKNCGFDIQFNMRDFVCIKKKSEMIYNLPCYVISSPDLRRNCGTHHCGPYGELSISLQGFSQRCRSLLCDLNCTKRVLINKCGQNEGKRALQFLVDYTKEQVFSWIKSATKEHEDFSNLENIIPQSCSRIFCPYFNTTQCEY